MLEASIAAFLLSTQAAPISSEQRNDIRCFVVAAEMADTEDKEVQTAASIMMFYFLGKLDGRNPKSDLDAVFEREAQLMSDDDKKALTATCAKTVEERGKQLAN